MKSKTYHPRKAMAALAQVEHQLYAMLKAGGDGLTPGEKQAVYDACELLSTAYTSVYKRVPEPRFSLALYAAREAKKQAKQGFRKRRAT